MGMRPHPPPGTVLPGSKAASTEVAFVLDAREARFLTEVGMLAAGRGDVARADKIFAFLRRQRLDRAFPLIGLALARLNAGAAAEAAQLLQDVRLSDANEQLVVRSWYGLALQLAGRAAESRHVLLEASQGSGDGAVLARQLLGLGSDMSDK